MAKRSFSNPSWTPVAVAVTATMTANGACFIKGGSSTQRTRIHEIYMGGGAAAAAPLLMEFGRDSTVAVTSITLGTNGKDAWLGAASADLAAPVTPGFSATTMPQKSATLGGLLDLAYNAFGGVVRWVTKDDQVIDMLGNTASLGELSLSAFTGSSASGLMASHIHYETD
jgi:hypothetical protein